MKKLFLVMAISLLGALMACTTKSEPAEIPIISESLPKETQMTGKEAWQIEWEKTLQAAKKEGSVTMLSTRGGEFREALMGGFYKKYGIRLDVTVGKSDDNLAKTLAERGAGLYLQDVQIAGLSTSYIYRKKGTLQRFPPALILSEVAERKYWKGTAPWIEGDDSRYLIVPGYRPHFGIMYNANLVKRGELKSYFDLLQPKWKGKIIVEDPTDMGSGQGTFVKIKMIIDQAGKDGEYFWRQLAKQEPYVTRDQKLMLQWIMRGKYAISFGKGTEDIIYAREGGAPVDVFIPEEGTWDGSSGTLLFFDKAPHPNAAKVFINWYLSKEGQDLTQPHLGAESRRVDFNTELVEPWLRYQPGAKYISFVTEEWEAVIRPALLPLAQEIFLPLVK